MSMIADVFQVMLADNKTKEEFATATMESAGFKITSETTDVEGGGGLVAVLHSPRKETITLKDVRYHFDILAKQLGSTIVVGVGSAYQFPKDYTVTTETTNKVITLDQTPKTSSDLKLTTSDGTALTLTTDYTITDKKITITKTEVAAGDVISVGSYLYATDAKTGTITIDNSKYPNGVTCVLQTLEISEDELPMNIIQIIFDKCVFDGDITVDTTSKRDASRHDMNLKVLNMLGDSKIAGRIVRIPYVAS